jgi:acetyl esterase
VLRRSNADSLPLGERLQSVVVRGLAALPTRAQLLLAGGSPVRIDGQQLEPEVQLMLRLMELAKRPTFESLPVPEAREEIRREAALFAGSPLPLAHVRELAIPGPAGAIPARLYVPVGVPEPSPLLVYLHGGGWVLGDLDTHDQTCRFIAREGRLRVLAADYRLAPEHPFPAPVEDALAALRFALGEAEQLGADRGRVAVGGDSAGGNLAAIAARLAVDQGGPAPAFQLLIYPVTDLSHKRHSYELFREGFFLTERQMDWYRNHYLPDAEAARDPRVSPLLADDLRGLPPAHVAVAGFDVLRDEGEEYARRLIAAGVATTVERHAGMIHGFVNASTVGRTPRRALRSIIAALREGLAANRAATAALPGPARQA